MGPSFKIDSCLELKGPLDQAGKKNIFVNMLASLKKRALN